MAATVEVPRPGTECQLKLLKHWIILTHCTKPRIESPPVQQSLQLDFFFPSHFWQDFPLWCKGISGILGVLGTGFDPLASTVGVFWFCFSHFGVPLGQGSDPNLSCDVSHNCGNARLFTHCTRN